jgi:hypothetical protein
MAKIKSYARIITNDYDSEDQPLVEKMGSQINEGFDPIYGALSNRLTFEENFLCTVRDVEMTVGSNGIPLNRISMSLNNNLPVKGVLVLSVSNRTNAAVYPTGAPFISFTQNANVLYIDHITGLVPNNRYNIKILALN